MLVRGAAFPRNTRVRYGIYWEPIEGWPRLFREGTVDIDPQGRLRLDLEIEADDPTGRYWFIPVFDPAQQWYNSLSPRIACYQVE